MSLGQNLLVLFKKKRVCEFVSEHSSGRFNLFLLSVNKYLSTNFCFYFFPKFNREKEISTIQFNILLIELFGPLFNIVIPRNNDVSQKLTLSAKLFCGLPQYTLSLFSKITTQTGTFKKMLKLKSSKNFKTAQPLLKK